MKLLAVAAVGAALLAGCSSGQHTTTPAARASSSAPASPSPSATSTVRQWASVIASVKDQVTAAAAESQNCPLASDAGVCGMQRFSFGVAVQTLDVDLQGATSPASPGYLGDPPVEIAKLLQQTQAATDQMKSAEQDRRQYCPSGKTCPAVLMAWAQAQDELTSTLAAWGPYTG